MGLDQDDPVIRRRLQQKLEFVTDDVAALAEPTDAELAAYLKAHADVFASIGSLLSARFIWIQAKHGERLTQDIDQLLIQLQQQGRDVDLYSLGDAFLLEHRFEAAPATEIAKQFGDKFVAKLGDFPVGQWFGPVESGYGVHLVFVEERTEGRLPELAEVRDAVRREWTNARRLESNEKFFQSLLKHYEVVVEKIDPAKGGPKIRKREMIIQPRVLEQKLSRRWAKLVLSVCFGAILFASSTSLVSAHEVRPAYLELRQTGS